MDDLFLPSPEFFYQLGPPSGLRPSEVECHVDYWKNARRTLVGSYFQAFLGRLFFDFWLVFGLFLTGGGIGGGREGREGEVHQSAVC